MRMPSIWAPAVVIALPVAVGCGDITLFTQQTPQPPYESIVEQFTQAPVPSRDILWLIDNTGSMEAELAALAPVFNDFIGQLDDPYHISYQVGVITTDLDNDQGELQGIPWIITPSTEDADEVFSENVTEIIDSANSPANEEGLEAIVTALSDEMLSAGSKNYGFLRADAGLSIIAVSDGDDKSSPHGLNDDGEVVAYYVDALKEIKGGGSRDRIIFSAIVGPEDGCIANGKAAAEGTRYIDVAAQLNGTVESICSQDYSSVVKSIGADQVVLQSQFSLAHAPLADSLVVLVDEEQVVEGSGWAYDSALQALVFDAASVPPFGAVIQVAYRYASY